MRAISIALATVFVVSAVPATAQLQSKHQIKCLKDLWKSSVQVSHAQGKENVHCAKMAGKGKLPMSAQSCLTADMRKRVVKKHQRTTVIAGAKCAVETPTFGSTDADTVNQEGSGKQVALVGALFGGDLDAALIPCSDDRDACSCQVKVLSKAADLVKTQLAEFSNCTKRAVKVNKHPFLGGVLSTDELERCLYDAATSWSVAADERGKVGKVSAKLSKTVADHCGDPSGLFPGQCSAAAGPALAACVEDAADCQTCLGLNAMFALDVDCDLRDDDASNGSCVSP